jgi:hypothetical protein
MGTILTIVLIILLGAALPTFPYSLRYAEGRSAPTTRNDHATSLGQDPLLETHVQTSRVRRTWSDKLKMWQCAYETTIWDSRRAITGRASSAEASQKVAETQWLKLRRGELEEGVTDLRP